MKIKAILGFVKELLPIFGDVKDNINDDQGGVGRFFTPRFIKQITRLIIAVVATYLLAKSNISFDEFVLILKEIKLDGWL